MADLDEDGPLRHRLLSPMADLDEDILPSILPLTLASSAQLTNNIVAKGRLMRKMMLMVEVKRKMMMRDNCVLLPY